MFKILAALPLSAALLTAASTQVSVTTIGRQNFFACYETKTDGTTAACHAQFSTGRGTAISSIWSYEANRFSWFGSIHRTVTTSGATIASTASVILDNEFTALSYGQGVSIQYDVESFDNADLQPVRIFVDDGDGNFVLLTTLDPTRRRRALDIPYNGHPLRIKLEVERTDPSSTEDYVALFHLDIAAF